MKLLSAVAKELTRCPTEINDYYTFLLLKSKGRKVTYTGDPV
jgi:hypothetical protein